MKKCLLFFVFIVSIGCNKLDIDKDVPSCIKKKIKKMAKDPCGEGANAKEFLFQDQTVYLLTVGNCPDVGSSVFDQNCKLLGTLGDLSGTKEINGVNFKNNSTFVKYVWKDE